MGVQSSWPGMDATINHRLCPNQIVIHDTLNCQPTRENYSVLCIGISNVSRNVHTEANILGLMVGLIKIGIEGPEREFVVGHFEESKHNHPVKIPIDLSSHVTC
jgi:hypothetical protein